MISSQLSLDYSTLIIDYSVFAALIASAHPQVRVTSSSADNLTFSYNIFQMLIKYYNYGHCMNSFPCMLNILIMQLNNRAVSHVVMHRLRLTLCGHCGVYKCNGDASVRCLV